MAPQRLELQQALPRDGVREPSIPSRAPSLSQGQVIVAQRLLREPNVPPEVRAGLIRRMAGDGGGAPLGQARAGVPVAMPQEQHSGPQTQPGGAAHGPAPAVLDVGELACADVALALALPQPGAKHPLARADQTAQALRALMPLAEALTQLERPPGAGSWNQAAHAAKGPAGAFADVVLTQLSQARLDDMVHRDTHRTAVQAARELLTAKTPEALAKLTSDSRLEAGAWKETQAWRAEPSGAMPHEGLSGPRSETTQDNSMAERREAREVGAATARANDIRVDGRPQVPLLGAPQASTAEAQPQHPRRTHNKVLGSNFLWNVLHLWREESPAEIDDTLDVIRRVAITLVTGLIFAAIMALGIWLR